MVKIRLKRLGRRHRAEYRLCVMDARSPRDGKTIEEIGVYAPQTRDSAKQFSVNAERVKYWLSVGAQPSETAHDLLAQAGIVPAAARTPRDAAKTAALAAATAASVKLQGEVEAKRKKDKEKGK